MALAVAGHRNDAIVQYTCMLDKCTDDGPLSVLLCNRAVVNYSLELFRASFKDACAAMEMDSSNLRAYILKGNGKFVLACPPSNAMFHRFR